MQQNLRFHLFFIFFNEYLCQRNLLFFFFSPYNAIIIISKPVGFRF